MKFITITKLKSSLINLFIISLALSMFGCGDVKLNDTTKIEVGFAGISAGTTAPSSAFDGGVYLTGKKTDGSARIAFGLDTLSFNNNHEISTGKWKFSAYSWDCANTSNCNIGKGIIRCGTTTQTLNGPSDDIKLNLSSGNCSTSHYVVSNPTLKFCTDFNSSSSPTTCINNNVVSSFQIILGGGLYDDNLNIPLSAPLSEPFLMMGKKVTAISTAYDCFSASAGSGTATGFNIPAHSDMFIKVKTFSDPSCSTPLKTYDYFKPTHPERDGINFDQSTTLTTYDNDLAFGGVSSSIPVAMTTNSESFYFLSTANAGSNGYVPVFSKIDLNATHGITGALSSCSILKSCYANSGFNPASPGCSATDNMTDTSYQGTVSVSANGIATYNVIGNHTANAIILNGTAPAIIPYHKVEIQCSNSSGASVILYEWLNSSAGTANNSLLYPLYNMIGSKSPASINLTNYFNGTSASPTFSKTVGAPSTGALAPTITGNNLVCGSGGTPGTFDQYTIQASVAGPPTATATITLQCHY